MNGVLCRKVEGMVYCSGKWNEWFSADECGVNGILNVLESGINGALCRKEECMVYCVGKWNKWFTV